MLDQLVGFLARGLVRHPDEVRVNAIQGESIVVFEVRVADDDLPRLLGPQERNLRAMRQVLSAASGRKKAVIEVVNPHELVEEQAAEE
jgi:hypothetical protein